MGTPKALLKMDGAAFLERLTAAFAPACEPLIVVLGYDAARIQESLTGAGVDVVVIPIERGAVQLAAMRPAGDPGSK